MVLSTLLASCILLGTTPTPSSGEVTLPLSELLPLISSPIAPTAGAPPMRALVVVSALKGRLTEDALLIEGHFEIDVLAKDAWTQVELFEMSPGAYLTELPELEQATVAPFDQHLVFVTQRPGRHSFDVHLAIRAEPGPARHATLRLGRSLPVVPLRLESDPAVFAILSPTTGGIGEAREAYPRDGMLGVSWRSLHPAAPGRVAVRPPLEPTIPIARATWVSTLEGKASLRIQYLLRLDREQTLELELPEGQRLSRLTLNGNPIAVVAQGRTVQLKVSPVRLGEQEAKVELVLAQDLGTFHLSGMLRLGLPKVSWPVAEVRARVHFPEVFNYRRAGGSLEPDDRAGAPDSESDTLPGKALGFRQFLVAASAPNLELGYSVDIAKSYFK